MGAFDFVSNVMTGGGAAMAASGAAALGGGAWLGYRGVQDTNQANRDIAAARNLMEVQEAAKARDWSGGESQKSRDFQAQQVLQKMAYDERLSSTAVQRRMDDMRKAGINPILAGKYDASTPAAAAGAGAVGSTAKANAHGYEAKNKYQGMLDNVGSALSLMKMASEIKNINAQTSLTSRKEDLTDPVNSMMQLLQSVIDKYVGSATDRKTMGDKIHEVLVDKPAEAKRIRNSPGIELTPYAEKRRKQHKSSQNQRRNYRH